ncbi:SDR family oxidoreductase [Actinomycetospora chiangmaiensis]|uniref:SDR family oxidoreductase n=1 Tax=Actinomycetospora chiangmaiensis TaxID=402650 RepID=UPI000371F0E8|nr:SDR family oxidoreductase [Actinomycetospora chiangmaiensis]
MAERTALVTGAASGIGAALVGLLPDAGWRVLALDRAPVPAAPDVETLTCDLTDPAQVAAVVARVRDEVSAVAHVAGVPGTAPASTVLAVNVLAARRLIEPLLGTLDSVVTVASVAQYRSPEPDDVLDELLACGDAADLDRWLARHPHAGPAAYDTSKKALVRWTRLTAGRHIGGARLNAVSPGPVETPILRDFRTSMGEADIDRAAAAVGRHGRPDEVAAAVAFLLGPSASWIRGVDLPVEGGLLAARAAAAAAAVVVN